LHTFKNIWANSNSLNHIWVSFIQTWGQLETSGQIGRVSFRFAYIINIWANYSSTDQNWANWNNLCATFLLELCDPKTRQTIELESCSNPLRIQQVV